jgi:DNA-binding response OmpR family regulator
MAVLMDWAMPGMDGIAAVKRIRQKESDVQTPIVMVSAAFIIGVEKDFLDAGADELLPKPVSRRDLAEKLNLLKQRTSPGHKA